TSRPSSLRSCATLRPPAPLLPGRYHRRRARRCGVRYLRTWGSLKMTSVVASWFETRGVAALLTMRIVDLILRSAPLVRVSKDEASDRSAPTASAPRGRPACPGANHAALRWLSIAALSSPELARSSWFAPGRA